MRKGFEVSLRSFHTAYQRRAEGKRSQLDVFDAPNQLTPGPFYFSKIPIISKLPAQRQPTTRLIKTVFIPRHCQSVRGSLIQSLAQRLLSLPKTLLFSKC